MLLNGKTGIGIVNDGGEGCFSFFLQRIVLLSVVKYSILPSDILIFTKSFDEVKKDRLVALFCFNSELGY